MSSLGPTFVQTAVSVITAPTFLANTLTPPTIGAAQDDYAPTGFASCNVLRLEPTGATRELRGLAGGSEGRLILIHNVSTSVTLKFIHDASTSSAANRFFLTGGVAGGEFQLPAGGSVVLEYDGISSRWRVHGQAFGDYLSTPAALSGAGTPGTSPYYSPRDHVHPANSLAVDTLWAAAGDIAYATGADAATVLSIGSAFRLLRANSGATAPEWIGGYSLVGDSGVLGADTATIDFTSISATYATFLALIYGRTDDTTVGCYMRVNNISTATYDYQGISVVNAAVSGFPTPAANQAFVIPVTQTGATANIFGGGFVIIGNEGGSNRKTWTSVGGAMGTESATTTTWEVDVTQGKNRANTVISRLTFGVGTFGTTKFKTGSRIILYGGVV